MKTRMLALAAAVAVVALGLPSPATAAVLSLSGGKTDTMGFASFTGTLECVPCGNSIDPTNPVVSLTINGVMVPAAKITPKVTNCNLTLTVQLNWVVPAKTLPVDIKVKLANGTVEPITAITFVKTGPGGGGCSSDDETDLLAAPNGSPKCVAPAKSEPGSPESK